MDLLQRGELGGAAGGAEPGLRDRRVEHLGAPAQLPAARPGHLGPRHLVRDPVQGSEDAAAGHLHHLPRRVSFVLQTLSSLSPPPPFFFHIMVFLVLTNTPCPSPLFPSNRCITYATLQPTWNTAQIVLNVLSGIGQSGPLTLLVACVQFTAPHAFLSTATGLAFSARAIGGAFGSAVLNAIINGRLSSHLGGAVGDAAIGAGLPRASVPELLEALDAGTLFDGIGIPGATPEVLAAAVEASRAEYAHAYRLAWASVIPFVVLAIVAVALMKGVRDLMTEKVEATVERVAASDTTKQEPVKVKV